MSEDDQVKALARLDGWSRTPEFDYVLQHPFYLAGTKVETWSRGSEMACFKFSYLTSRDAIVSVIEKQVAKVQLEVAMRFWNHNYQIDTNMLNILLTPANQLCEALLRATGKWKE